MNEDQIVDDSLEQISNDTLLELVNAAANNLNERRLTKNQKKNDSIDEVRESFKRYKTEKIKQITKNST